MTKKLLVTDFIGNAEARSSPALKKVEELFKDKGGNVETHEVIGAKFFSTDNGLFSASILCIDKEKSIDKDHIVSIKFIEEITIKEFFYLFEELQVFLCKERFSGKEIQEEITV